MAEFWMVRAGRGGSQIDVFRDKSCVAIGWSVIGDLTSIVDKKELRERYQDVYAGISAQHMAHGIGIVSRFRLEIEKGDPVITYDPGNRPYSVGTIVGDYEYHPDYGEHVGHVRNVEWRGYVNRDDLSKSSRNKLGSLLTIFKPGMAVQREFEQLLSGSAAAEPEKEDGGGSEDVPGELLERAHESIKDKLSGLDWEEMQDVVAAVLRAMGYKTRVSPKGSDQGKDIVASPDGLGLAEPRIKVEVKHRPKTQMGAPALRSFIGGLRQNDRGLYVSTGGFSKEAVYEAERATVPVALLTLDDLAKLLVGNYESIDAEGRALVPLRRIYWPVQS